MKALAPLVPLALALLITPAHANAPIDLAALDRSVAAFTGVPIGQPGGAAAPLDRRLRLARCPAEPVLGWHGTRREAVQLRCPVAGGWTLYVPVIGTGAALTAAPLVQPGDAVSIVVAGEGFALSQPGEALEGGAGGTWIKVRGLAPKAPVLRGRVLRPGVVGVELP